MNDRDHVLSSIRRSLGRGRPSPERLGGAQARLAAPPANPVPARARIAHDRQVAMFVAMATEVAATAARVPPSEVPTAVAAYLAGHSLPQELVAAPALRNAHDWEAQGLAVRFDNAAPDDQVGMVPAFAGVAETGTLVMLSAPETPTGLNFLPDTHIVLLAADDIVGTYEEVWQRVRTLPGGMPRTVNMVTGPSRTGDIEQTIQLGAHGPRRLHIVIVDG